MCDLASGPDFGAGVGNDGACVNKLSVDMNSTITHTHRGMMRIVAISERERERVSVSVERGYFATG